MSLLATFEFANDQTFIEADVSTERPAVSTTHTASFRTTFFAAVCAALISTNISTFCAPDRAALVPALVAAVVSAYIQTLRTAI
jgi:hypothetical protein